MGMDTLMSALSELVLLMSGSVSPLLFSTSVIGVTRGLISHASVRRVLPVVYPYSLVSFLLQREGGGGLFCNVSSSLSLLTEMKNSQTHTHTQGKNAQSF